MLSRPFSFRTGSLLARREREGAVGNGFVQVLVRELLVIVQFHGQAPQNCLAGGSDAVLDDLL